MARAVADARLGVIHRTHSNNALSPKTPELLGSPLFDPPEARRMAGRPSSRQAPAATTRRSRQGMKPLAARAFARPLTASSIVAAPNRAQLKHATEWGILLRHFWGNSIRH